MGSDSIGGSNIGDYYREHDTEDYSRAASFATRHIHMPYDYKSYRSDTFSQWKEDAEKAREQNQPIRAMWLRRNNEDTNEFSSCVDYVVPTDDGVLRYASLVIGSDGGHTEIEVLLPAQDGSQEEVVATCEPYSMESLHRAIKLVEVQYS